MFKITSNKLDLYVYLIQDWDDNVYTMFICESFQFPKTIFLASVTLIGDTQYSELILGCRLTS